MIIKKGGFVWPELISRSYYCLEAWCIGGGGFNITGFAHERFPFGRVIKGMQKFNCFIESTNLMEVPLSNGRYTWSWEGSSVSRSLIDRFFVTKAWDEVFENTRVTRQACRLSYHFPLLLESGLFCWDPSPFRFCNSWLTNKECIRIVERAGGRSRINGWAGFILSAKLRNVKTAVKAWYAEFQKLQKRKEEELLEEIDKWDALSETVRLSPYVIDNRTFLRAELMTIYRLEERNLIQKSKLNWLTLGDENSNFFYRFLAAKKRRNLITELINYCPNPICLYWGKTNTRSYFDCQRRCGRLSC